MNEHEHMSGEQHRRSGRRNWPARLLAMVCLLALCWGGWPGDVRGASTSERRALRSAASLFQDGFWDLAEQELTEFIKKYPDSELEGEATLLLAQAKFKRNNYAGAVELLEGRFNRAGAWADQYRFWLAEAFFHQGDYARAAGIYGRLVQEFPRSNRLLEASFGEAYCRFKLNDFNRVRDLLGAPEGVFAGVAKSRPNEELVVRGRLLLGEVHFLSRSLAEARKAVAAVEVRNLSQDLLWQRDFLLARISHGEGDWGTALTLSSNLIAHATNPSQPGQYAESVFLQGNIFEQLQRPAVAVAVYERSLDRLPIESRRQALLKMIALTLQYGTITETIARLENFASRYGADPAMDLAEVTLGELRLKLYFDQVEKRGATNPVETATLQLLKQAQLHFARVMSDFSSSPLAAKASLNRGWCLWLQGLIPDSQAAFQRAAEQLPLSEDKAIARFKVGDTCFWQKDYTNALRNYRLVLADFDQVPTVKNGLSGQVFYQIARLGVLLNDLKTAESALQNILERFPDSYYPERVVLTVGQALNQVDQPARARAVFTDFLTRFGSQSLLAPEIELAVARTHAQEENWPAAIAAYDQWQVRHPAHPQLPAAQYDLGWAYYRAGEETNSLSVYTNLAVSFPGDLVAQQARFWVAGFYFRQQDFPQAEAQYQMVFQNTNWPVNELTWQARMMAGRSAVARQGLKDAGDYFRSLFNDECPPEIGAEACFALADVLIEEPSADPAKPLEKYREAIAALSKIPQIYATNRLVPAAWGRIGDCYLQLAGAEAKYYERAQEYYTKVLAAPASVPVRSQAEVGLGLLWEKQILTLPAVERPEAIKRALEHYLNVVHGNNLNEELGEKADPFWVKKAGLAAANLAETQQQWETAIRLYQRLQGLLPALQDQWARKIKAAREAMSGAKPVAQP
jgi:TolA-binding protein